MERITILNLIFSYFKWFKSGNSHFQNLWTHLAKRGKQALRVTKKQIEDSAQVSRAWDTSPNPTGHALSAVLAMAQ